jgi:hypothetical protein
VYFMAITLVCNCGQQMLTGNATAGRQVQCPRCRSSLQVPDFQQAYQPPVAAPPASPVAAIPMPAAEAATPPAPRPEAQPPAHLSPPVPEPLLGAGDFTLVYVPPSPPPQPIVPPSPPQAIPIFDQISSQPLAPVSPPQAIPVFDQISSLPLTPASPPHAEPVRDQIPFFEERSGLSIEKPGDAASEKREKQKRKDKLKTKRSQFKLVNLGLGLYYGKLLCYLIGILIMLFVVILATLVASTGSVAGDAPRPGATAAESVSLAAVGIIVIIDVCIMVFLAPLLGMTASILCCWVPPRSQARPLIITSASLDVASIVLGIVVFAMGLLVGFTGSGRLAEIAILPALILFLLVFTSMVTAWILFMLFLRKLANYLDDETTGDEAFSLMVQTVLFCVATPIVTAVQAILAALIMYLGQALALIIGTVWLILSFKLMFRNLNLISTLRALVQRRAGL